MQKGTWASLERDWRLWEVWILCKWAVFQVFVFPQASHLALSPLWLICLRILPWVHAYPSAKVGLKVKALGEQDALWPGIIPWLLTPKEPFCPGVVSPLSHKGGIGDPLILSSTRVFPLFVLAVIITLTTAVTITLRSLQEAKTGYLPCFCCYFHFGGQTGGWL